MNDSIEEGYEGEFRGELDYVPGFDDGYATSEGTESDEVDVPQGFEDEPPHDTDHGTEKTIRELLDVCGRDDRKPVTGTTRTPWSSVCKLYITHAVGPGAGCTGWFIGPGTVMTAAHCLYRNGHFAQRVRVIPGMNGRIRPFGHQDAEQDRIRVSDGWKSSPRRENDYGAVLLDDLSLGNRVGWFGFGVYSHTFLRHRIINTPGYPGDKPPGTMWFNAGRITSVAARSLSYMNDTKGGHSGGPVYIKIGGKRYGVAVHGYGGCPNSGVRITDEVFAKMREWKREAGGG